jgi:hypothetical protein
MRLRALRTVFILSLFTLAACVTTGPQPSYPEITFAHLAPIKLDVAEIVYAPRYQPPIAAPNIGHEFPTPPAKAAERWIADRLVAVGTSGQAIVVIRQATGTETKLKVKKGITGAFTTDQAWRYDVGVEIVINAVSLNRKINAEASTAAQQSRTMPEDASLSEREDVWFALTENVMRKFDTNFEAQIRKDLAKFIK